MLNVRVSQSERALLEAAAEQADTNISGFVRQKALEAAEMHLLEHRIVAIPAEHWDRFKSWAFAPAEEIPGLRKLAATDRAQQA